MRPGWGVSNEVVQVSWQAGNQASTGCTTFPLIIGETGTIRSSNGLASTVSATIKASGNHWPFVHEAEGLGFVYMRPTARTCGRPQLTSVSAALARRMLRFVTNQVQAGARKSRGGCRNTAIFYPLHACSEVSAANVGGAEPWFGG